jgi:hypothetical protein
MRGIEVRKFRVFLKALPTRTVMLSLMAAEIKEPR